MQKQFNPYIQSMNMQNVNLQSQFITTQLISPFCDPPQQQRPTVESLPELPPVVAPVQQVAAQGEAVQPAPNIIQTAPLQPSVSVQTHPPAKKQRLE